MVFLTFLTAPSSTQPLWFNTSPSKAVGTALTGTGLSNSHKPCKADHSRGGNLILKSMSSSISPDLPVYFLFLYCFLIGQIYPIWITF